MLVEFNAVCTNHFVERYAERILELQSKEVKEYVTQENIQKLSTLFNSMNKEFLCQADFHDQKMSNFYLMKDSQPSYIIVTNQSNQAYITLYYVDFGLGDNINDYATKDILKSILEKQENKNVILSDISSKKESFLTKIDTLDAKINSLMTEIEQLNDIKKSTILQVECLDKEVKIADEDLKRTAYKLIYSTNYNFEKVRK